MEQKPSKWYHGFTVVGKAVLVKRVSDQRSHGLVEDSKTVAPRVSTAIAIIKCNSIGYGNLTISSGQPRPPDAMRSSPCKPVRSLVKFYGDLFNQHIHHAVRIDSFTLRGEGCHEAMSQDGMSNRLDVLGCHMETTF